MKQTWVDDHWREYVPHVRAAVEAMREPTVAMSRAGAGFPADEFDDGSTHVVSDTAVDVWQAMIDAALKEIA